MKYQEPKILAGVHIKSTHLLPPKHDFLMFAQQ